MGYDSLSDVRACVMDVDGDGWVDLVCGGIWYRNPQRPPFAPDGYVNSSPKATTAGGIRVRRKFAGFRHRIVSSMDLVRLLFRKYQ